MHKADWHLATSLPMRPKPAGSSNTGVTIPVYIMEVPQRQLARCFGCNKGPFGSIFRTIDADPDLVTGAIGRCRLLLGRRLSRNRPGHHSMTFTAQAADVGSSRLPFGVRDGHFALEAHHIWQLAPRLLDCAMTQNSSLSTRTSLLSLAPWCCEGAAQGRRWKKSVDPDLLADAHALQGLQEPLAYSDAFLSRF